MRSAFPTRLHTSIRMGMALLALALGACASVPDTGTRPALLAPQDVAAERSLAPGAGAAWPGEGWWSGFGDAQLAAIVEEGLRNSPDLAAAAARLRRASGLAQQAGAARLPALDARGGVSLDKQSLNNRLSGQFRQFLPRGWNDNGELAAQLDFELDIWGRNRAALAAATSEARAAAIEANQARLLLTTGIALAYTDLARLFEERDIGQAALAIRLATQKLVADREANGLETRGSLRQAEAEVATAQANLAAAEEAIALRRNQISALLGAGPDRGLAIARPSLPASVQTGLPEGVTTELVGRRPDIVVARERVEAAASRIRVARADFYPAIRLDALFGVQSLGVDKLFRSDSTFGAVGPAVSLPLFHGGALRGRYRSARAGYDEAVAGYNGAVVTAYQEVADVVTSRRLVGERLAHARAALAASEEAYSIARLRYEGGLSGYLDVLPVEDRLLQARLAVAGLDATARSLDIALIRALGGGFDTTADKLAQDEPR